MKILATRDQSPLVSFRLVFGAGALADPAPLGGAAWLTALLLSSGGSRTHTYKQLLDAFFPMGVSVASSVDKEMTTFSADVHIDHLPTFYPLLRSMLLDPGWREEDFDRLLDDTVNYLEVGLRGENDEEFAKEALYSEIYRGHPYSRHNAGSVSSLRALTVADLKAFYLANYAQSNLTIALGGGFPLGFDEQLRRDFCALPLKAREPQPLPAPAEIPASTALLIEKPARGIAISLGFPLEVRRGHPDYPALALAVSALGQHRMSSGRLFASLRQHRGLNYGDYAYLEYFPGGMYSLEPEPNQFRRAEIFQLWIRPVEPDQAHFALRLALHELDRFVRDGLTPAEFDRARNFLTKYAKLLLKTRSLELGYAIDSLAYGIPPYPAYLAANLARLTVEDVNAAIRRHLRADRFRLAAVGENMESFRAQLLAGAPSPIAYNSPKPPEILAEDAIVQAREIPLSEIKVVPAATLFA